MDGWKHSISVRDLRTIQSWPCLFLCLFVRAKEKEFQLAVISSLLTGVLIDAATSTAIDVLAKRTVDPRIKMAGRAWRVYSLLSTTFDLESAWRIAAYSDVGQIIFSEIVVQRLSEEMTSSIPTLDGVNFELQQKAGAFICTPDFTNRFAHDPYLLTPYGMSLDRSRFIQREIDTVGEPLIDMVLPCVERALRACVSANEILSYPETLRPGRIVQLGSSAHMA